MPRRPTGRQRSVPVGVYLLAALTAAVVASCGAPNSSKSAVSGRSSAPRPAPARVLATPTPPPDPAQQIAYTSNVTLRVQQVSKGTDDATNLIQRAGGFVFSQAATYQGSPESTLALRVPPGQFRPVLAQLAALGTVLNQNVTADDVTQQVADLNGRLQTASASAERLRGLLARAAGTSDIVAIESELEKREQEIESVQGQINALASRVNYATINLKLVERGTAKVSKNIPGFGSGLHGGWVAFINVGKALLTASGAILPFLPFLVIAVLIGIRYRRWRRAHPRERPVRAAAWPAAAPYGPASYPPVPPTRPPPSGPGPVGETGGMAPVPPAGPVAPAPGSGQGQGGDPEPDNGAIP